MGNWIDVIGVFSVKSTITTGDEEYVSLVYMEDKQIEDLKDVFWNMNVISHEIIEKEMGSDTTQSVTAASNPRVSSSSTPEPTTEIYINAGHIR